MSKFKVTLADGNVAEVDATSIEAPENYIIADSTNGIDGFVRQEVMDTTIADRVNKAKQNALKDAFKQEMVRNQVLSEYGIELGEDGKPKGLKDAEFDLDKERSKWEKTVLTPLQEQLDTTQSTLGNITGSLAKQSIMSAFAGKAKEEYLDSELGDPYVVAVLGTKFKYNKDVNKVIQYDEQGNPEMHPNGKKSNGHGYIEPSDFIEINRDSALLKRIIKDDTQGGSGVKPGSGGDKNTKTRQEIEAMSPSEAQKFFADGGRAV